jgi:ubiquinone/menaquinone biosynthesis C-methylase UbiE
MGIRGWNGPSWTSCGPPAATRTGWSRRSWPAWIFADQFGATVHGVDLTPSFVCAAESLTRWTGLSGRVSFSTGSALRLTFGAAESDVATLVHVGMNIADKDALFAQAHRVLRPGGVFAIYDIMRTKLAVGLLPTGLQKTPRI